MRRRTKSTSRRATGAAMLAASLALATPAASPAAPAAADEYSRGPVGSRLIERETPGSLPAAQESDPKVRVDPGVVGETDPAESPLAVVGSIASPAVWALCVAVALATALILLPRRRKVTAP